MVAIKFICCKVRQIIKKFKIFDETFDKTFE